MAVKLSKNGKVAVASNTVAEQGTWTLTISNELAEAGAFSDDWKKIAGKTTGSWTATFSGWGDSTDTNGQIALENAAISGTALATIRLYEDATNYWVCDTDSDANATAYVSSYAATVDKSTLNAVTFTIEGSGPVHRTSD